MTPPELATWEHSVAEKLRELAAMAEERAAAGVSPVASGALRALHSVLADAASTADRVSRITTEAANDNPQPSG